MFTPLYREISPWLRAGLVGEHTKPPFDYCATQALLRNLSGLRLPRARKVEPRG